MGGSCSTTRATEIRPIPSLPAPTRLLLRDRSIAALLGGSIAAGTAATVLTVAWLILLASVVAEVFVGRGDLADVVPQLTVAAGLLAGRSVCVWAGEVLGDRASGRFRTAVRSDLVDDLVAAGPAGLSEERTGDVAGVVGAGVESLHEYVTRFVPAGALGVVAPVVVFVAVAVLDPWTTLILLFTGPMLVLLLAVIGGRTKELTRRRFDELGWLSAFYLDMVRGFGTLKAFRRSEEGAGAIESVSRRFGDTTMEVLRTAFQTSLVMEWAATAATALAAVQISFRVVDDSLEFGTALAVLMLVPEFFVPFRRLALEYHAGQSGSAALERIAALHGPPATAPDTAVPVASVAAPVASVVATPAVAVAPAVQLVGVGYRYPGAERSALDGVSFSLSSGEVVALTGPSGSGKTTVAHLLLRFMDPTEGRILVDGAPLGEQDPRAWRRRIAWVPQRPTLIAGTIAENIALGEPGASPERVRAAAAVAQIGDFVDSLPDGLDTPLGERGLRLSAGQRQRLAIARAALRDAPLVVFDEFSAHLDERTECELLDAVARLLVGRTALVIAHRPRTIELASRTLVLADGRIAGVRG